MAKRAFSHNGSNHPASDIADGVPARTLIEGAYVRLRDDIVEGRLAPGAKLRIAHLKNSYCVGAGTLREAITRLAGDALIISEGQRGFWVAPITIKDLEDLTRLRMHIEIEALRQSIRAADPEWKKQVRTAYAQMSAVEQPIQQDQRKQWDALNTQFHEALVSGVDSPWTLRVLRILSRQSERYRYLAIHLPNTGRDVHAEHALIFEAAMAGAESRAALALEMHIRATPDLIARAYDNGSIPGKIAASGTAHASLTPPTGN